MKKILTGSHEMSEKMPPEEMDYLTTDQGVRINDNQNTLKAGERGPSLLEDFIFREKIMHFDHERIPERIVHARGAGAHGYFQVYETMKKYTKAKFLQDPLLKTPVFVRFSTVAGFRGSADTVRDARGFATKFYTEEGNYDLVGNNIPVFFIQDAIKFPDLVHALKPEPHNEIPQASSAHDNFWDFISLMPESIHMIMWVLSDRALPRSYSMMEGFGVHTFRFVNEQGQSHFIKFHWKPKNGVCSLLFEEAQLIAGKDPDFNRRDLWESIEIGCYPEYELGVQILEEQEAEKLEFDFLDATKLWPEEEVPVKIIGKMILNRNPDNFFAETEQAAFHPGHIVPGIDFSNDPLLQGRLFSYLDTQLIRLGGPNFHEIPINRPICPVSNNQRDGFMRQTVNKGRINYEPNSLGGGCPMEAGWKSGGFVSFPEKIQGEKIRKRPETFNDHYSQASLFWNSMSKPEKSHIAKAFRFELGKVGFKHIQEKMIQHLNQVNHSLAAEVAEGLGLDVPLEIKGSGYKKSSPLLSQESHKPSSIRGRKIAVLAAEGVNKTRLEELIKEIVREGALAFVIAKNLGNLKSEENDLIKVDKSFLTESSVMYDAIFLPAGTHAEALKKQPEALIFVQEVYRHCKPILAIGEGNELLQYCGLKENLCLDSDWNQSFSRQGIVSAGKKADFKVVFKDFSKALMEHRHWERE